MNAPGAGRALDELARLIGALEWASALRQQRVESIAAPAAADRASLSFFVAGVHPARSAHESKAAAILTDRDGAQAVPPARRIVVDDVALACARAAAWLEVRRRPECAAAGGHAGIAVDALIAPSAVLAGDVYIGERAVIGAGVVLGRGCRVGAFSCIGAGSVIGACTSIGNRVRLGASVSVGDDGFAFVRDGPVWVRVPSFGSATIDDDAQVLAHSVIHAGVFTDTAIGRGCALDSHVLIGHDSCVGAHTAIAGHTAVAGSVRIGQHCRIGGKAGIGEGVVLADGVMIGAMSLVTQSISTAGATYTAAWPAQPAAAWWRQVAGLRRAGRRAPAAPAPSREE